MTRPLEAQPRPFNPQSVHGAIAANAPTRCYATLEEVANVHLRADFASTGMHIVIDSGRSGSGGALPAVARQA
jgi:hypothetical protein